jgi:leucyl/phenylalanyl-tRNA--protein transferase
LPPLAAWRLTRIRKRQFRECGKISDVVRSGRECGAGADNIGMLSHGRQRQPEKVHVNYLKLCPRVPWVPPEQADEDGFVGLGGNLEPPCLLRAYSEGVFPWFNEGDPILWWSPNPRAIFELDRFHISRRLQRTFRSGKFQITVNRDFAAVIRGCAVRIEGTWITAAMIDAYERLHELGHAQSVEAWQDGELAGGVYGVAIGAFFAAESMFYRRTDGSKAALAALVERLRERGYELLDTQFVTPHTRSLGAIEIPRAVYIKRLRAAIQRRDVRFD